MFGHNRPLMTRHVAALALASLAALPIGIWAQETKTLTASVKVTTSDDRRNVAVLSKGGGSEPAFLFCIDLAAPTPQKLEYTGPARVFYRPLPLEGIPEGVKISGPEDVSLALGVVPAQGKGWLFLAKNEKTVLPATEGAGVTTVTASMVRRVDWVGDNGVRRGLDIEPCFNAGG